MPFAQIARPPGLRLNGASDSLRSTVMTGHEKLLELWGKVRALAAEHADIEGSTLSPDMKMRKCTNINNQMQKLIGVIQSDTMREIICT
jgi:hypothetical protein